MDKIQNAIAKARAVRNGENPPPQPRAAEPANTAGPTSEAVLSQAAMAEIDAAWKALPVLKYNAKLMKRNRVVTMDGGPDSRTIDMMRTRVLQQMRDNGWRRLAITSPTAGCGKSTVSLNLALSLQRQPDLRTLLLELDLRRPALAKMMGAELGINFETVLEGALPFSECARRYAPNLAIATSARPTRTATELLASRQMPQILEEIETEFAPDVVIFDTPPMLETDDMMAFARHVDCVLLVAGAEGTTVKEIDICERDLASQTNVMGVVLNKCRYMGPEYGYGYGD